MNKSSVRPMYVLMGHDHEGLKVADEHGMLIPVTFFKTRAEAEFWATKNQNMMQVAQWWAVRVDTPIVDEIQL